MPALRKKKPVNEVFLVEGGCPLRGEIEVAGNKNAALPILAATLLTEKRVILRRVPDILDVRAMTDLLESLGVKVRREEDGSLRVRAKQLTGANPDRDLSRRIRASILLAGPLLARQGFAEIWRPGGCVIGRRRLDTHLLGLRKMGATIECGNGIILKAPADGLKGCDLWLDEASVTATENLVMAAVLAKGVTRIYNAACEPHVQDLCVMLTAMGARIEGAGSNLLTIEGVERMRGADHEVIADHQEVGSLIAATAVTRGETLIKRAAPEHLPNILAAFETLGVHCEVRGSDLFVPANQSLEIMPEISGSIARISAQPWPNFPTDLLSVMIVLATQCKGAVMLHDKMYESRIFFTDRINAMGANVTICDPHRVIVMGPTPLKPGQHASPDIRAGVALLIAALAANGASQIEHVEIIDRGYERFGERLKGLGAKITRVKGESA
ncbi:MAG: UDP-N-acetylglucosamine 1-carboxyvinyltransferase [Candidatus Sumerlaeota bacterium]|nr:UDP-N-acetylglucosamine 1-carboxyvinyltransferase [Candidatus Sumerlaeota bacterium]